MPHETRIAARKPARNYRNPNDGVRQKPRENSNQGNTEPVDETNEKTRHADGRTPGKPRPPNKPGGSEQPGYRMKRAPFWQS